MQTRPLTPPQYRKRGSSPYSPAISRTRPLSRQLPDVHPRLGPVREPLGDEFVPQQCQHPARRLARHVHGPRRARSCPRDAGRRERVLAERTSIDGTTVGRALIEDLGQRLGPHRARGDAPRANAGRVVPGDGKDRDAPRARPSGLLPLVDAGGDLVPSHVLHLAVEQDQIERNGLDCGEHCLPAVDRHDAVAGAVAEHDDEVAVDERHRPSTAKASRASPSDAVEAHEPSGAAAPGFLESARSATAFGRARPRGRMASLSVTVLPP